MIGFSTVLGVGLFLSTGKAIYMAGPGGAVLAYLLAGTIMWYVAFPLNFAIGHPINAHKVRYGMYWGDDCPISSKRADFRISTPVRRRVSRIIYWLAFLVSFSDSTYEWS